MMSILNKSKKIFFQPYYENIFDVFYNFYLCIFYHFSTKYFEPIVTQKQKAQ